MKRRDIKEMGKIGTPFRETDYSEVYKLKNGSYLKIFKPKMMSLCKTAGVSLKEKITSLEPINEVPEIIMPDIAVTERNKFVGYVMPPAKGISLMTYYSEKTNDQLLDLQLYAEEFSGLEDVVRRSNQKGIVFPDLLTFSNIFISDKDGRISYNFIDVDGIQFKPEKEHGCVQISKRLGNEFQYHTSKYSKSLAIFNSNLDKKSLFLAYFMIVCGFNIQQLIDSKYGEDKVRTFDAIMNDLNVPRQLKEIAEIALFDDNKDNLYLGGLVDEIADKYQLQVFSKNENIRQFVRK
ncbi:MAG: hypothetical protein IJR82_00620 [Bacilli bacterium]|nr:hypothetical protein [Bacilli bacterium]